MDFSEALLLLREGKKIRRKDWTSGVYLELEDVSILPHPLIVQAEDETGGVVIYTISQDDLFADWEEYKD